MFEVELYETRDGRIPCKEFLETLDDKTRGKLLRVIDNLKSIGNALGMPHSKPIGDGLFELRAEVKTNAYRMLYFFVIGKKIIITNGFTKKTEKTPQKEIELAKKYRADFNSRP